MQEGPSKIVIPATEHITCNGCKFLEKTPGIRGRSKVTNNYHCTHGDAPKKTMPNLNWSSFNIGWNIEGLPEPPIFCPYNK